MSPVTESAAERAPAPSLRLPRPRACGAIIWRDYLTKRSYKSGLALDAFHGVVTLGIYFFISRFFGRPDTAALNDAPSYFAFAAAGIITGGMLLSIAVDVSRGVRDEQLTGTLEALAAEPLTPTELSVGLVGFPYAFTFTRALVYLVIASTAMSIDLAGVSWLGLVAVLLAGGATFAAIAIAAAALGLVVKRADLITTMVVTVINVLSGSVFPISTLPGWLQPIARVLPTHLAFDGVRNALFRGEGWVFDFSVLVAMAAVGIPVAAAIFARAMAAAERSGSLAEY